MVTWRELTTAYLESLRLQHYSPITVTIHQGWLSRFEALCRDEGAERPVDVCEDHVAAFQRRLLWTPVRDGRLNSASTVDQALRVVRAFFRWAQMQDHLLTDPTDRLVLHRVTTAPPRLLTEDEMEKLLAAPSARTPTGLRNRAMLETFYATGIRRSECRGLDLDDVDFANRTILVRQGKGARDRYLPLGDGLASVLLRYLLKARPKLVRHDEAALFVSANGHRLSLIGIHAIVRSVGRAAGLGVVSSHRLRHAFAAHLLKGGADLEEVQALLGHEHLTTTRSYTSHVPVDLHEEHRRTHPRAADEPDEEPPTFPTSS